MSASKTPVKKPRAAAAGKAVPVQRLAPQDIVNNRLFFRLFQTVNLYEREVQNALGMSAIQGAIMGELASRPGRCMPLAELVDYLAVSRQNLDGVLKRLEQLGYVERTVDESNRRSRLMHLTPAGTRAWNQVFSRSLEFYRGAAAQLVRADKELMTELLGRIGRSLRDQAAARQGLEAPDHDPGP